MIKEEFENSFRLLSVQTHAPPHCEFISQPFSQYTIAVFLMSSLI